jgi:hypothetical protein
MLKYTITGADRLHARLEQMPRRVHEILTVAMDKFLEQIKGKLVRKMSGELLKKRTGALVESVTVSPAQDEGNRIHGAVYIPPASGPALYASAHEWGVASPWAILATKQRALHFVSGGKEYFRKMVTHPPLPAKHMFAGTEEESREEFRARMQEAIRQAMEEE